jgi:allantoin racemase
MMSAPEKETASQSDDTMRIWYQSFVDLQQQQSYIERLKEGLHSYAEPKTAFDVHGIDPPDRYLHPLTEFRCASRTIRNAIEAEQLGYDAFVIGHFQEPGLLESRATIDIPVVGLGEATMLYACSLGRKVGLVTINPVFIPWHQEQIAHYGLEKRVIDVSSIDAQVSTFTRAFQDESTYLKVREEFVRQAKPLLKKGVEVIIPAGGLPMLLFAREREFIIDGAVVLNGIAVIAKAAEMSVKLHRLTGVVASRAGTFAKAPAEAVKEFLASAGN